MASSVVKSAAQQVGSLLVQEAKFLYQVQGKIESLQTELEWMECFLEDADNRQQKEKLLRKWITQVTDFAYKVEDIMERYLHEVSGQHRDGIWDIVKWFSDLLCACRVCKLHFLGSEIEDLTIKISELNSRLTRYGVKFISPTEDMAYNAMMREERRTYAHVEEEVVGMEKDVQQVVDQFTKTNVKVISISGMGGLGKSTLARRVYVDPNVKEYFESNCVWVYISKGFNTKSVFEEILMGLQAGASGIKDQPVEVLAKTIHEIFQNKKCLVVLDDIWSTEAWDSLLPAFCSIKSDSIGKILISTRNQELLQHVDSNGYPHDLEQMSDENSWKLLQLKAFPKTWGQEKEEATSSKDKSTRIVTTTFDTDDKTRMEKLGRGMLKHCNGLPLAIVALGGILSSKRTPLEWEEVLKNISVYLDGGILSVLELSYQDLPFNLKPCFLYLANFPEDYEISTERLYHLWEAEGILADPTKDETEVEGVTSYEIGERYLLGLIQRSMVQVGKRWPSGRIKTCRIHDLMRDMCVKRCKETSFLNVKEYYYPDGVQSVFFEGLGTRKQIYRCAFHGKVEGDAESSSTQHRQIRLPSVRSVMLFRLNCSLYFYSYDLSEVVKRFPMLRVLDMEDGFATEINKVVEIERLIHLRYLNLRGMSMLKFSLQIWDLKYVITLDLRLRHQQMKTIEFPNAFNQMRRLKHLYLPLSFEIKGDKRLTFKADQMETLRNFNPENCDLKDLLQMTRLRVLSINSRYTFSNKDELKFLAEAPVVKSQHLVNSLRLQIAAEVLDTDPSVLFSTFKGNPCFTRLFIIGILNKEEAFECHNMEDAIARGVQVFPSNLTQLRIKNCKLGREVILALEKLPYLRMLRFDSVNMGNKLSFSVGSFLQLNVLDFEHVEELEEWEVGDGALPNLQRLELDYCNKLKKLPEGLPNSTHIRCYEPCIKGFERYNTCPYFEPQDECN